MKKILILDSILEKIQATWHFDRIPQFRNGYSIGNICVLGFIYYCRCIWDNKALFALLSAPLFYIKKPELGNKFLLLASQEGAQLGIKCLFFSFKHFKIV